jgi:hypothetical protein
MKYITNIDTLSALFDRLITESIKLYFFKKDNIEDKVKHQESIIIKIKNKIVILLRDTYEKREYDYISEKRTFSVENDIVESLEKLIVNDINVGECDREKLKEVRSQNPSIEKMIFNEKKMRKSNEGRAINKNQIDESYKNLLD